MLKKRDLHEVPALYELLTHPEVFPYVRHKAYSVDEYYFLTKQTMEAEEQGELITRTIVNEFHHPIGTISLFDLHDNKGFLATWIGQPYFGKGYNKLAKEAFFEELFETAGIKAIFIKIRKTNTRSLKAMLKIPFVSLGNILYREIFEKINANEPVYELFVITKEQYFLHRALHHETHTTVNDEETAV
ncbi:GNAT family N-acetyltransferase [Aquibacillus sp. 3ASR75-11]|uniref:GNAT family N-acetyltransferase n=1 Tax=Terrihalobacillus insolitus TaxID=2950438 RepID=A0A9X4AP81_9BACI|nr:GNAT family N-acetyltransferase [Terrihalobacillus insolitus]MDC3425275.1 GNAT family N-acetyltransferase [Terrihalobacillus insolitus]